MPQPTSSDLHVSSLLTNISTAYMQEASAFVAGQVFPIVPVDNQGDKYATYDKKYWFMNKAKKRAPATESAGSGYEVSNDSYLCDVIAFHHDVDDQARANADSVFSLDSDATKLVARMLLMWKEIDWIDKYFKAGVWATTLQGVAGVPGAGQFRQLDNANSTPITIIKTAIRTIQRNTGLKPNVLTISGEVFDILSEHASIIDKIKYTEKGIVTTDLLTALFGVSKVVIAEAVQNIANEGQAANMQFLHGKHMLLTHSAPSPGLLVPTAGYTFGWKGLLGSDAFGGRIKKFRIETIESDRVEGEMAVDHKLVATDLGYFFADAIA